MSMKISLCTDKNLWNAGQATFAKTESFLQSWDWGEFQLSVGNRPVRLVFKEAGEVVAKIQGFSHKLGFGLRYFYAPRVFIARDEELKLFFDQLKQLGFIFARVELKKNILLEDESFYLVPNRQPQHTLILDLTKTEDELMAGMHSKTRYNINLAERKQVVVKKEKDIDIFWELNKQTTGRDGFKSHGKNYYEKMLQLDFVYQLTAYVGEVAIGSIILIKHNNTATYLHGASSNEHRNFMAPYLLQWEGIKLAKELGCTEYDFWGVAPSVDNKKQGAGNNERESVNKYQGTYFHNYEWIADHKWTGITRFKAGFGGEAVSYPNAVEIGLQPLKYKLFRLARRLKK